MNRTRISFPHKQNITLHNWLFFLLALFFIAAIPTLSRAENRFPTPRAIDYPHHVNSDYQYKTGRFTPPPSEKTLWDYLSFFSWKPDPHQGHHFPAKESIAIRARVRELTIQLISNSKETFVDEYALTVNTFVNLSNLYKTSTLGRYISEQMIGELQMAGAEVIDVRKSAGLMIHERLGEFGLSRRMNELSYVHASQAMVVGTYTYAQGQIIINARLLRNSDGLVISNSSIAFELDPVTLQMLADEAMPPQGGGMVKVEEYNKEMR